MKIIREIVHVIGALTLVGALVAVSLASPDTTPFRVFARVAASFSVICFAIAVSDRPQRSLGWCWRLLLLALSLAACGWVFSHPIGG